MSAQDRTGWTDRIPLARRLVRLPGQLLGKSPFAGTIAPRRVPLLAPRSDRPSLPFPHRWNYKEPLRILETFFWNADADEGSARHNRYLEVPGFAPILVTRDPQVIRAISADTGDKPGQFDRDTMPSVGIARATGRDSLLFANGALWKSQKKLATPPFARTTLFQPDQFREFAAGFRQTALRRLDLVRARLASNGEPLRTMLEPEIKAVMLEMLVNTFFGAQVSYEDIRNRYVPALDCVIDHIVTDTVVNRLGVPLSILPGLTPRLAQVKHARKLFEDLTTLVLARRRDGRGLWSQFKSDAPDEALRSNIRVFLAGALEATTSYASWALSHLARDAISQQNVFEEVRQLEDYTPETLAHARHLGSVLDETLRLTPSLYFHPRRARIDTWIETTDGRRLMIPAGTHILLDIWHANRHEDHWGVAMTGHPAIDFVPERWANIESDARSDARFLHFGFGHGPRFCPGKSLGQLEVALVVGACVKLFRMDAVHAANPARAGVSTKPLDGVLVDLRLREPRIPAVDTASQSAAGLQTH